MKGIGICRFIRKIGNFLSVIVLPLLAFNAHAVFINFDDLTYVPVDPENPFFADVPLDNQYLDQGLSIINAYLLPYGEGGGDDIISAPNYLLIGASGSLMSLHFVDVLPTSVGMYIGSFSGERQHLSIYGPSGLIGEHDTYGHGGHPDTHTDYVPRQYVEFESASGIQHIDIYGAYGSRAAGFIDDITYTYASVPEPSLLFLFGLGIFPLWYCRRKRTSEKIS